MTGWKGTPGPWSVVPEPQHAGGYRIKGPLGPHGVFFPTIATDLTFEDAQQRQADAAGIAAVPQLVEALLEIHEATAKQQLPITSQVHQLTGDALRAAKVIP